MKILFAVLLAVSLSMLAGCASQELEVSHLVSGFVGLKRHVTLYSANGTIIREWTGQFNLETDGPTMNFLIDGKRITLTGTVVIEEIQ